MGGIERLRSRKDSLTFSRIEKLMIKTVFFHIYIGCDILLYHPEVKHYNLHPV